MSNDHTIPVPAGNKGILVFQSHPKISHPKQCEQNLVSQQMSDHTIILVITPKIVN